MQSFSARRAFTRMEVLTVISIILVVGTLIYPAFARRPQQNLNPAEARNQKQVALALLMYIQDYDEKFPPAASYTNLRTGGKTYQYLQSWGPDRKLPDGRVVPGLLSPYVKSMDVFLDPNNTSDSKDRILELMYNDLMVGQSLANVESVAYTVAFTSAENRLENAGHALTPDSGPFAATFNKKGGCDPGKGASIRTARLRNNGGTYFTFIDGHVKWFQGGAEDSIYFPPRESVNRSASAPKTLRGMGPRLSDGGVYKGRKYLGSFLIN